MEGCPDSVLDFLEHFFYSFFLEFCNEHTLNMLCGVLLKSMHAQLMAIMIMLGCKMSIGAGQFMRSCAPEKYCKFALDGNNVTLNP